jgi:hypothetical protein
MDSKYIFVNISIPFEAKNGSYDVILERMLLDIKPCKKLPAINTSENDWKLFKQIFLIQKGSGSSEGSSSEGSSSEGSSLEGSSSEGSSSEGSSLEGSSLEGSSSEGSSSEGSSLEGSSSEGSSSEGSSLEGSSLEGSSSEKPIFVFDTKIAQGKTRQNITIRNRSNKSTHFTRKKYESDLNSDTVVGSVPKLTVLEES